MSRVAHIDRGDRKRISGQTGFTLVELLVVIGIIAVLISLLLPSLNKAREASSKVACAANMRSIGQGIYLYAQANKGVMPYAYWDGTPTGDTSTGPQSTDWVSLISNALDSKQTALITGNRTGGVRKMFRCPSAPPNTSDDAVVLATYSTHPRLMPNLERADRLRNGMTGTTQFYLQPYKLAKIKRSTEVVMVFEAPVTINGSAAAGGAVTAQGRWSASPDAYGLDGSSITLSYSGPTGNNGSWLTDNYALGSAAPNFTAGSFVSVFQPVISNVNTDSYANWANVRFRHANNRQMNGLCADGHVESFELRKDNTRSSLKRLNVNVNLD